MKIKRNKNCEQKIFNNFNIYDFVYFFMHEKQTKFVKYGWRKNNES